MKLTMQIMSATNSFRNIAALMLATAMVSPLDAFAGRDQKCVQDCTQRGYQWDLCDSRCSYSTRTDYNELNRLMGQTYSGAVRRAEEQAQRQRLLQEQIENQKLQNEILRRQLEAQ